jgi:uncharacterized caspase-like protein
MAVVSCFGIASAVALAQGVDDARKEAEKSLVVDCREPPSLRRFDARTTHIIPGQVVRTSVDACKRGGGTYVAFDQANPDLAAQVWREAADLGDDVAQFRLGQIYEMGIDGKPDYAQAARWYQKAADQGNRQAAKNLAVLNEKGLGVPESKPKATKLYQEAQSPALAPTAVTPESAPPKPSIQLIDPSLIVTRGDMGEVLVRGEVRSRQITGRVKPADVASLSVDGKEIRPDPYGLFQDTVLLSDTGTTVRILAVGREGGRDEVVIHFKAAKPDAADAPVARPAITPGALGRYHALVVGNNLYQHWSELQTAVNDANAIGDLLRRKYAFNVRVLRNATFDDTLNAINDLVNTLQENDSLLIYYAGHGYFDLARRGYWIPVDAERDRNTRWILNVQITDLLLKMKARKVLVISDSCYSGALAEPEVDAGHPLVGRAPPDARLEAAKRDLKLRTRRLLSSGGIQPVWDISMAGNSLFARALLDVLNANQDILDGQRLFDSLEGRVIKASRDIREREERAGRKSPVPSDQTPIYASIQFAGDEGGDFVFVPVAN